MPAQRGQANDNKGKEVDCAQCGSRHSIGVLALGLPWARGMHFFATEPTVIAAQPAPTPQPVASPASAAGTQPGTTVELSPAEITAAGVQVAEVRTASLKTDIDAFGRVEQPEAQLAAVSARIGGRVDKLYVQYTGERVRNGQPVADLYSPEVATAIEEYRLAEENRNGLQPVGRQLCTRTSRCAGDGKPAQAGALGNHRKADRCARKGRRTACDHLLLCLGNGCRSQGDARPICECRRHAVYRGRSQPGMDQGRCVRGATAADSPGAGG